MFQEANLTVFLVMEQWILWNRLVSQCDLLYSCVVI